MNTTLFTLADEGKPFMDYFDSTIGWVYMLAWSASFYGQVYEN